MAKDNRAANRYGRCFRRRKELFELESLKPADHIVEERYLTFWHHMIVESVEGEKINVIHFYNKRGPSGFGSTVCRGEISFQRDK